MKEKLCLSPLELRIERRLKAYEAARVKQAQAKDAELAVTSRLLFVEEHAVKVALEQWGAPYCHDGFVYSLRGKGELYRGSLELSEYHARKRNRAARSAKGFRLEEW